MKRSFIVPSLFFFLGCFQFSQAQQAAPVHLIEQAAAVKGDTSRLKALIHAADSFLMLYQPGLGKQALEIARQSLKGNTPVTLQSDFYWLLGELYYKEKQYAAVEKTADTLLALHQNNPDQLWRIKGLIQKSFALIHQTKLSAATALLQEAISASVKAGSKYYEAKGYHGIGAIAFQGRQIAEVKKQYKRAIELFLEGGFDTEAAMLACSLSRTFVAEKDIYIDSAFYWNEQAKPIAIKNPGNLELNYIIWQNEADYFARSGDFAKANKAFEKAEAVAVTMPNKYSLGGLLQVRSYAAFNAGKIEEALSIARRSKDIFEEMGDFSMLKKSFQLLYVINEEKGDYKAAFDALNEYVDISDSILTQQSMAQINDLNIKYETSKKEKTIAEQQLSLTQKNANLRTLIISLAAIATALLLLAVIYFQRRKTYQQSLITLKKEQDISLLKALMTGEEKERNRLARELHDGLGGILAAAQMQISNVETNGQEAEKTKKQKAAELVSQAAVESRRIAHNLLPETLLRYGLDEALKEYSQSITDSKLLQLDYESVGMQTRLEPGAELSIYRIIQELVNNIVKHSGATEALVQVHQQEGKLSVTVEDNGRGFAPQQNGKTGIGLSNIQSRVSYLNGSLDIRSNRQQGTSVYIEIQLDKNAAA